MLAFDKWTCNTNGRQAIFFRRRSEARNQAPAPHDAQMPYQTQMPYQAQMIDQGFCFNAGEWNFPDAPLRGLYTRHRVYEWVGGPEAFEAWIARIERLEARDLEEAASEIPPEWYAEDASALERLLEQLLRRRKMVMDLIVSAWKSSAQPFPNWK